MDIVIDSMFLFDIIVNFFSVIEDRNGNLNYNRLDIAKNYL